MPAAAASHCSRVNIDGFLNEVKRAVIGQCMAAQKEGGREGEGEEVTPDMYTDQRSACLPARLTD